MLIDSAPPATMMSAPPRADSVGGHGDRLQSRSAESVDGHAGNRVRQAGAQRRDARHVIAGFGFGHGAAEDDVVHFRCGDLG